MMIGYEGLKTKKEKKAEKGDTRMEDISCDLDYMMDVMPRVGKVRCCAVGPAADDAPRGHAPGSGRPVVDTRPSSLRLHSGN